VTISSIDGLRRRWYAAGVILVLASLVAAFGLFVAPHDALAQTRPQLQTLPLDEPVPFFPELATGPFELIERPDGVYLIRSATAQVLARLPKLDPDAFSQSLPGFSLDSVSENEELPSTLRGAPGFPLDLPASPAGSAAIGDLTGDGRSEIIVALQDGQIWALDSAGEFVPGWPVFLEDPVRHAPQLVDIDADGNLDVLVGTLRGFAYALDSGGDHLLGWPICIESDSNSELLWAAPTAGDIRPNLAGLEVAIAGTEGTVQLFGAGGQPLPGWPRRFPAATLPPNPAACFSHPTIADLQDDGELEIVTGHNSGLIGVQSSRGRPLTGWPRSFAGQPRLGYGSILVRDLDAGGGREMVAATDGKFNGRPELWVLRPDGRPRPGWPVSLPEAVTGGIATADFNGDGQHEIIVAGIGGDGEINVLGLNGRSLPGWPQKFAETTFGLGPAVADFDGDGAQEIAVLGSAVSYGARTSLFILESDGSHWDGFPIEREGYDAYDGGLAVGDLDRDGSLELVVLSAGLSRLEVFQFPGDGRREAIGWARSEFGSSEPPRAGESGGPTFPVGPPTQGPLSPANPYLSEVEIQLPSPLDPRSTLTFLLRQPQPVRLEIVTVQGILLRTLVEAELPQGLFALSWDGTSDSGALQPTGVYFFQLTVAGETHRKQLLLLR